MKKLIFTLSFLFTVLLLQAGTYYWVGGPTGTWTAATSWSLTSGGAPITRTADASDILIFDAASGPVTVQPSAEMVTSLQVLAGGNLTFTRTSATGTTTYTLTGSLVVEAGAFFTVTSSGTFSTAVNLNATSLSTIYGDVTISGAGANRIAPLAPNILIFAAGSSCLASATGTSSIFGTTSSTIPTADRGVKFLAGSTFKLRTTINPFSGSSLNILQMDPLSNFRLEAPIINSLFGASATPRPLGNLIIANNQLGGTSVNQTVLLNGILVYVDSLIVESGNTLTMASTGPISLAGSVIINSGAAIAVNTSPAPTSSVLLMIGGGALQTVGGTGTFNPIGLLSAGTNSNVQLLRNITLIGGSTATQSGKLDVGTNIISGSAPFQFRAGGSGPSTTATTTARGFVVTLDALAYSGSVNTANVNVGYLVTGPNFLPDTYIVATSSTNNQITISKAALTTSTTLGTTAVIVGGIGTLQTANPGGIDGSIATTGTRNFGSGTNYIFNAPTATPFASNTNTTGNVTFSGAVTTNGNLRIGGALTLGTGNLTIRPVDSLYINSTGSIVGAGPSKYIVTDKGATSTGVLSRTGFTAATQFPVGSPARYMPVTIAPQSGSADFSIGVFEGITNEGTVDGTPYTAMQKADAVDAVWTINRNAFPTPAATAPCDVTISWDAALEGANFAANPNVGITHHNGTLFEPAVGTGNNTTNTATATFSSFSPFSIAPLPFVVPVRFININASYNNNKVNVSWKTAADENVSGYTVEKAGADMRFSPAGNIASRHETGNADYALTDASPFSGNNYYRIKATGNNGEIKYSAIAKINISGVADFSVLQNPVKNHAAQINISNTAAGRYNLSLVNTAGQTVFTQTLNHAGGSISSTLSIPAAISAGIYRIVFRGADDVKTATIVIE